MQILKNKLIENSKQFGARWATWVISNRWLVMGLSLLLVVAFGTGLPKLGFDGDYRAFFSKENPQLKAFDELQNKYTQDDNVLIVIEGETIMRQVADFCEVPLSTATWTVDKLVEKKYLKRVNSLDDRRIVKVSLTKKGIGVFVMFQQKKYEMGQRMLSDLSEEKQQAFIEIAEQIAKNLQSHLDTAPDQ